MAREREMEIAKAARAYCEQFRYAYQQAKLHSNPAEYLFNRFRGGLLLLDLCKIVFDDDFEFDKPMCPGCGSGMLPNGSCFKCPNCGETSGCS